ncbi:hypothetical protein [Actinomycetospora termitidis]|uniref:Uncharacterized protein n=1 Tax=Actinomycetospora termitidis TaxID=3053470 RepID=A0ABT7MIU3_9PSEU|nr:hypothetical protein [Actinomycetospora sp. Odt1-22]MDL5160596.1 hypothetical protein [Actinomycetospora sp. Odt1-22]
MTSASDYDEAAFTLRPVGAFLEGNATDLEALAELTKGAEHYVEQATIDGATTWVLRSPRIEQLWDKPGRMHLEAQQVVRTVNGIALAERASFRKVAVTGRYSGPGNTMNVVSVECAIVSESAFVVGVGAPSPPPPPARAYFEAINRNPVLRQVLDLLARDDELSPASMWKIFELIRREVTGLYDRRAAQREFLRQGWFSSEENKNFADVVNDQHRSGDDARHAAHQRTEGTATIEDARILLRRLVRDWQASL